MKLYLFLILIVTSQICNAQQIRDSELRKLMDDGVSLMERGYYDSAQQKFKKVLLNMDKLPSDMAYFFGRNSFHIGKYKQSINWLNKYIQLKGTNGQHYEMAVKFLTLSEDEYLIIQRKQKTQLTTDLIEAEYDCGGLEKMLCPVCHGSGVIIKAGLFNDVYKTCPYSLSEGYLSCEEYNLFMKGDLEPKMK